MLIMYSTHFSLYIPPIFYFIELFFIVFRQKVCSKNNKKCFVNFKIMVWSYENSPKIISFFVDRIEANLSQKMDYEVLAIWPYKCCGF